MSGRADIWKEHWSVDIIERWARGGSTIVAEKEGTRTVHRGIQTREYLGTEVLVPLELVKQVPR